MSLRPLDLLDLPTLYRYRGEAVSLDSARLLTRGNPLGAVGMLAYMNPQRHIYTAVLEGDGIDLLGGITQSRSETFAKLHYLAPSSQLTHPGLQTLIDGLTAEAGSWGAYHVLAEIDESSDAFIALRRSGFSVYAWQRMWYVGKPGPSDITHRWSRARSVDFVAVQNLYYQIVPPLLQPVEPLPKRSSGFIYDQEVRCYVSTFAGMAGMVLNPLIHPEAVDVGAKLTALLCYLPNHNGRPVYLCVRSYQAWLEPVLEDLGAKAVGRQAVMVKHLARRARDEQAVKAVQPTGVSVQPSRVSRFSEHEN